MWGEFMESRDQVKGRSISKVVSYDDFVTSACRRRESVERALRTSYVVILQNSARNSRNLCGRVRLCCPCLPWGGHSTPLSLWTRIFICTPNRRVSSPVSFSLGQCDHSEGTTRYGYGRPLCAGLLLDFLFLGFLSSLSLL